MKIRISKNSLRYRLTRSEVERFATEGAITETTRIGNQTITYSLQRVVTEQIGVAYEGNSITLTVPEAIADSWTGTEQVGFEHTDDNNLLLLVEKDFVCLDKVAEDQSDNYPNPLAVGK